MHDYLVGDTPQTNVTHLRWNTGVNSDILLPSGEYQVTIVQVLKGKADHQETLHLPLLEQFYFDGAAVTVNNLHYLLIFLDSSPANGFTPVDAHVPFVPLGNTVSEIPPSAADDLTATIVKLILPSLTDPALRQPNSYVLRNVQSPLLEKPLLQYSHDANPCVRENALYGLAVNQMVAVIPHIAQLQLNLAQQGSGTECVTALQSLETPKAIPYLNPLLFEPDEYLRLNAAMDLQKIADSSSIPYLILALHDPDPQNVIPYTAYLALHRLIPKLPKDANDFDYTMPIPQKDLAPIYQWWNDELMGVHYYPSDHVTPLNNAPSLAQLNLGLARREPADRERVSRILLVKAERTSIPYLILALQDPDAKVSYNAYRALHRLIPSLGMAQNAAQFTAYQDADCQPLYDWWRDELLGKHLPTHRP